MDRGDESCEQLRDGTGGVIYHLPCFFILGGVLFLFFLGGWRVEGWGGKIQEAFYFFSCKMNILGVMT